MSDLLVPLLKLPDLAPHLERAAAQGTVIRRARSFEKSEVRRFVARHFSEGWADEAEVSFSRVPSGCYLATRDKRIVGFSVIESTAPAFFGPTGVDPAYRRKGLGTALLLAAMHGLRERGHVYSVIGWAGPVSFYVKTVNAIPSPDSEPGIYSDLLTPDDTRPR